MVGGGTPTIGKKLVADGAEVSATNHREKITWQQCRSFHTIGEEPSNNAPFGRCSVTDHTRDAISYTTSA